MPRAKRIINSYKPRPGSNAPQLARVTHNAVRRLSRRAARMKDRRKVIYLKGELDHA